MKQSEARYVINIVSIFEDQPVRGRPYSKQLDVIRHSSSGIQSVDFSFGENN